MRPHWTHCVAAFVVAVSLDMTSSTNAGDVAPVAPPAGIDRAQAESARLAQEREFQEQMRKQRVADEQAALSRIIKSPTEARADYIRLCSIGSKVSVPVLINALSGFPRATGSPATESAQFKCLDALWHLTGQRFGDDSDAWTRWWEERGKSLPDDYFFPSRRQSLEDVMASEKSNRNHKQTAEPGATDNPDGAQRLREDH